MVKNKEGLEMEMESFGGIAEVNVVLGNKLCARDEEAFTTLVAAPIQVQAANNENLSVKKTPQEQSSFSEIIYKKFQSVLVCV